jgi:hypothetical protein
MEAVEALVMPSEFYPLMLSRRPAVACVALPVGKGKIQRCWRGR